MSRILVVDDDHELLQLTGAVLASNGEVECVASTAEALRRIVAKEYDLLITDLNIDDTGDGLLVCGAMRCLCPNARRVLLTGYPDFPRALGALQATVDQVVLKPVDPNQLRELASLPRSERSTPSAVQLSIWQLMERERDHILDRWLEMVQQHEELGNINMDRSERLDHMDYVIGGFAKPNASSRELLSGAEQHGRQRRAAGYIPEFVLTEFSLLRRATIEFVLRNLLLLNLSRLTQDFFTIDLRIDAQLVSSLRAFGLRRRE